MAGQNGRPFTIVQLSDLHCGQQFFLPSLLERAIAEVNELRPDVVVISGDLTSHGFADEYALAREYVDADRVRLARRDPGKPRLAQRRLRPLRGAVRRAQLGAAARRRHDRRRRLDRARPRQRPDRPRPLPLDRGAVRGAGRPAHLRPAPPPAAGAGHRPRAEHRPRRRRHARDAAARRRRPRPLRAQARPLRLAARGPLRRQRRHRLVVAAARQGARVATTSSRSTAAHVDVWRRYPFHGQERIIQFSAETKTYEKYTARIEDEVRERAESVWR